MDALGAIIGRVSPRKLTAPGPTADHLQAILSAAAAAPDHGRLKPWRIVLIEESARAAFGELLVQSLKQREPDAVPTKLEAERAKAMRAPIILIVGAAPRDDSKIPRGEQIMAASAAAQNILIAAHALGYGGLWRTGAPAYDSLVKTRLGFAETDVIIGFLYIGTIDVGGPPRRAQPAECHRWSP